MTLQKRPRTFAEKFMLPSIVLTSQEQKQLLELARTALELYVTKQEILKITNPEQLPEHLRQPGACFVTYHKHKELRGCIGSLMASQSLYLEVIERAIDAAVHDYRFSSITPEELPHIEIEISFLTAPQDINSYEEFIIGTHGIILSKQGHRAVFLPQVAVEQNWTREETLTHLSMKAGLPSSAWKSGASFQVFTAQVFGKEI